MSKKRSNANSDRQKHLREQIGKVVADSLAERGLNADGDGGGDGGRDTGRRAIDDIGGRGPVIRSRQPEPEPGIAAARTVRLLGAAKGDIDKALRLGKDVQGRIWKDDLGDSVVRAMQAGQEVEGGFLVDPEFSQEIIEFLYNQAVFRRAGPETVDMPSGTMSIRKQTASMQANYVGESRPIPASEPEGGFVNLVAKKLTAMCPTSNELLQFSAAQGNRADVFIRNDIVRRIAVREDQAFIRDDGNEATPRGLRYWAPSDAITGSNYSGSDTANIEQDFTDLWQALEDANIGFSSPVWFMSPRAKTKLFTVREGAGGQRLFPNLTGANPSIWDVPVMSTNNIPSNLGGGNESELYLVDMAEMILGETGALEIDVDPSASYTVDGTLVSAFENDETLIRAKTKHDLVARHDEAIAIKTGVNYNQ